VWTNRVAFARNPADRAMAHRLLTGRAVAARRRRASTSSTASNNLMGNLLLPSTSTQPGIHRPQAPASSDTPVDQPIRWDDDAPLHFQYTPCLVLIKEISSDDPENATFNLMFLHTSTGRPVSGKWHSLTTTRATYGVVHATAPSTLPRRDDLGAGRCVCVLMLNVDALSDKAMLDDIKASAPDGKWPQSADEILQVSRVTQVLRKVLDTRGVRDALDSALRAQLQSLGLP
jgi:hypothetical protein